MLAMISPSVPNVAAMVTAAAVIIVALPNESRSVTVIVDSLPSATWTVGSAVTVELESDGGPGATRMVSAPPTPWERAAPDGVHYVSFATWMCPINCIEPATCPHTKGPRDWTMPATIRQYAERENLAGPALFHVTHRAYGVGMLNVADVLAADALVQEAASDRKADVLIGTVSHCHGALAVLSIGEPVRFQAWRSFATTTS